MERERERERDWHKEVLKKRCLLIFIKITRRRTTIKQRDRQKK